MPVSLSIKAVPDALVERLRRRAAGNGRSLQRELLAIVEAAVQIPTRAEMSGDVQMRPASVSPTAPLRVTESEAAWHVVPHSADDGLLEELDRIVAGSGWAQAPLLARDQLHDRSLSREIDFDARQTERAVALSSSEAGRS